MAITTIGAALIGGGLLGSAALSSSASKSAGNQVAAASDRAAELQNQQFNKLLELQMPAYQRGEHAAGLYMTALGIPQAQVAQPQAVFAPQVGAMTGATRTFKDYPVMAEGGGYPSPGIQTVGTGQVGQPAPVASGGLPTAQQPQVNIPEMVMNTPGYQAQLSQGLKAIDRAAPLTGGMYSGRRMKALSDYGQNTFGSYYSDWLNRVGGVAGQGQQTAQNVGAAGMQNANNVGQLMMTGANARAQGSLNSANAWTSAIGTGIGLYSGAKGWM